MNGVAVLQREMRACSREPLTFWLRLAAVLTLLLTCVLFYLTRRSRDLKGSELFSFIHAFSFVFIWIVAPLLTADSISRERREGTLPLLFLTWLSPMQVVGAKSIANISRALTLLIAVVPVTTVAFLIGGLSWKEVALSCGINFGSMALALSAGILASSLSWRWGRAIGLAAALGFLFFCCYIPGHALFVDLIARRYFPGSPSAFDAGFGMILMHMIDSGGIWSQMFAGTSILQQRVIVLTEIATAVGALVVFWLCVRSAAWLVARNWRMRDRSVVSQKAEEVFCRPIVGKSLLKRWMAWKINRNPVGWLEQRNWAGRLVSWIWVGVLVFIDTFVVSVSFSDRTFSRLQDMLMLGVVLSLAASAAGSFRRERENGVLELLLVSPLGEFRLIQGRIFALWGQFAPAMVLLLGVSMYWTANNPDTDVPVHILAFIASYLTVPFIGLYFSLTRRGFLAAFFWTVVIAEFLPIVFQAFLSLQFLPIRGIWKIYAYFPGLETGGLPVQLALLQLFVSVIFAFCLYDQLKRRRFDFGRA